jgi:hypothetical protein
MGVRYLADSLGQSLQWRDGYGRGLALSTSCRWPLIVRTPPVAIGCIRSARPTAPVDGELPVEVGFYRLVCAKSRFLRVEYWRGVLSKLRSGCPCNVRNPVKVYAGLTAKTWDRDGERRHGLYVRALQWRLRRGGEGGDRCSRWRACARLRKTLGLAGSESERQLRKHS